MINSANLSSDSCLMQILLLRTRLKHGVRSKYASYLFLDTTEFEWSNQKGRIRITCILASIELIALDR
jgi:hypothetical protein